jgi:hypothetical protein
MNTPPPPPRLYSIVATAAPVAVVFQRGPGKSWGIHRWNLSTGDLDTGAAFRGTLYPRRCDLSPDGNLLYYFALKRSSREFLGEIGLKTYSAVSKSPWLFALAAWRESGTWTRGYHFVDAAGTEEGAEIGQPHAGDAAPLRARFRLALRQTMPSQYAVERRRGWLEDQSCPKRGPNDMWDERRSAVLTKPRPSGKRAHADHLVLSDQGLKWEGGIEGRHPAYRLVQAKRTTDLADAVWADWDQHGRLLVATRDARLQIRDVDSADLTVIREHLITAPPPSVPAPEWAQRW